MGIVTGTYASVTMPVWLLLLAVAVIASFTIRRPIVQSVTIMVAVFMLGATLAANQARHPSTTTTHTSTVTAQRLLQQYKDHGLSGEAYAIVAAMTLADRTAISKELRHTYNVSGASHVLALSGLHMGIIYMLLSMLTFGRRRRLLVQVLTVVTIWAFVIMIGKPVSAMRAAAMISIYALLSLGYREKMSINALAFTAIVMLVINPRSLFDVGFQMSFLAVLSILLWMPLFTNNPSPSATHTPAILRWLWGMITVSVAAQIGVAPLIAYYFGRFSTYFLLTNIVVIPGATLILWLSPLVLLTAKIAPILSVLITTMNSCLKFIATLPGASIEGLHPSVLQVAFIYILITIVYLILNILKSQHSNL